MQTDIRNYEGKLILKDNIKKQLLKDLLMDYIKILKEKSLRKI